MNEISQVEGGYDAVWIYKYKAEYESEAIDILHRICANFSSEKKYLSCLEAARIIDEKL